MRGNLIQLSNSNMKSLLNSHITSPIQTCRIVLNLFDRYLTQTCLTIPLTTLLCNPQPPTHPPSNPQPPRNLTSSETSQRSNKNWSKDEDLQLTIAWDRTSTNSTKGVGQKRARFWDNVLAGFIELMETKHGVKRENNQRTCGGCENRMSEIKSQCSRWTAVRSRTFAQKLSGWSAADLEKHCHEMHEAEGKGAFKWEDYWDVLKESPKWHEWYNKKPGNNSGSTSRSTTGSRPVRPSPSTDAYVHENASNDLTPSSDAYVHEIASNDLTPDNMEMRTPVTPMTEPTHSEFEVGNNSRGTCTPNLDGPASIDIQRPIGMKKAKINNQRQRRNKQHLQAQSSASHSFNAGLMSLQSDTNSKWEMIADADRMRDLKDDERYNELRHIQHLEHEMNVASTRSKLAQDMGILGQKLLVDIQLLDQIDPLSLLTSTQKMTYEIRSKTVQDYQESYEALGEMLNKLKYISPRSARREENIASVSTSQRRLFDEDEVNLGDDS